MKKTLLIVSIVLVLFLVACGHQSDHENYENAKKQFEDEGYGLYIYDDNEIKECFDNAERILEIKFEKEILNITHSTKKQPFLWAYLYEFDSEKDAEIFYTKHALKWDHAKKEGKVVIFGNTALIENIKF